MSKPDDSFIPLTIRAEKLSGLLIPLGNDRDKAHVEENGNRVSPSSFVKNSIQILDENPQIGISSAPVMKISNSSKVTGALWSENE